MNPMLAMEASPTVQRKPRLLWANAYCLLDTSSGASKSAREMLLQLAKAGIDIQILGATNFDNERGTAGLFGMWDSIKDHAGKIVNIDDGLLRHALMVTASTNRAQMSAREESRWYSQYEKTLDSFKPDFVFYYGGHPLDLLASAEARYRRIPVGFYLVNGNYQGTRWCRDVNLILTDSQATAGFYRDRSGIEVTPVGAFIDSSQILAEQHTRKRLLFINPTPAKGSGIVAQIALMMEERRPDIEFEVVESRGSWAEIVRAVSASTGTPRDTLSNVIVTPHTADMRPLYGRARLLFAPSLWWDSFPRVLVEAMLNGIPALITDSGGMPEIVGDACVKLKLPEEYHKKPYNRIPTSEALQPLVERIEALYDDENLYADLVEKARKVGRDRHSIEVSTNRLINALTPWLSKCAGDRQSEMASGPQIRTATRPSLRTD